MIKSVYDTSAIISLASINLLEKSLKILKIFITNEVLDEINNMSKFKDIKGTSANKILRLIKEKKINVIKVSKDKTLLFTSKDVDKGEASCFSACIENEIKSLVIDDIDAAYSLQDLARIKGIKIRISVAIITELLKAKLMTKEESIKAIKNLIKIREWEGGVLEVLAERYLRGIKK